MPKIPSAVDFSSLLPNGEYPAGTNDEVLTVNHLRGIVQRACQNGLDFLEVRLFTSILEKYRDAHKAEELEVDLTEEEYEFVRKMIRQSRTPVEFVELIGAFQKQYQA